MNPLTRLRHDKHFEISHPKALATRNTQTNSNADSQAIEAKISKLLSDGVCASDISRALNISIEKIHKFEIDQSSTPRKVSKLVETNMVWSKEN